MSVNSYRGPYRRTVRLRGYDYAKPGIYFITICASERAHLFGEIVHGEMIMNDIGKILQRSYYDIIVRGFAAFSNISRYIINNPKNWTTDKFFGT